MAKKTNTITTKWKGPFAWPGYENVCGLPKLPGESGVYLMTFKYKDGYLIYGAGLTHRNVKERFKEHTREYLNGKYNILDIDAASNGVRKLVWHGWTYAKAHREEFEDKKTRLVAAASKQLAAFRIFVANVDHSERIHERLEHGIMKSLYAQRAPVSTLPDEGMHLSPRNSREPIITVKNRRKSNLFGLPETLEI